MICACTVTSRAVVGSSAINSRGRQRSAIAISTRWRMPPENSCGYMPIRAPASGTSIASRRRTDSARASRRPMPRCKVSTSVIWSEIRM